jgi:MoaA/NifB/PqqE/SkfB family radical SAM enzyme
MLHFTSKNIDKLYYSIKTGHLDQTVSLCHHCHMHIPAWRYHLDNKVYMAKSCSEHGISSHMIESDYEFYNGIYYTQDNPEFNFNGGVLIEGSDRCNLECPHCYHLPNTSKDVPISSLLDDIKKMSLGKDGVHRIILAGAESTLRRDFAELITSIRNLNSELDVSVMTNGLRFNDSKFAHKCVEAGLAGCNIGLNHPEYIDHATVRKKQLSAIENMQKENVKIGYISYTMIDFSELDYILNEITSNPWYPKNFRIRNGSEIGRNASNEQPFVSNLYKAVEKWCYINDKSFERIIEADNNIYHVMVKIEGKTVRLISWCDETNIDMEELRSGPWCNFVPDGITNFLHQIIRRDIWKNKNIDLPDTPPTRYLFNRNPSKEKLDLLKLSSAN